MSQGKFSAPRPHRDEERQIEQAFRQLTGQEPVKKEEPVLFTESATQPLPPVTEEAFPQDLAADLEAELETILEEPAPAPRRGAYERIESAPAPQPHQEVPQPRREVPQRSYRQEAVPFEEAFEEENEDTLDKVLRFVGENKKLIIAFLFAAALMIIVGISAAFFFGGSSKAEDDSGTIFDNVYIADIHVGGLTRQEAVTLVKQTTSSTYPRQDMVIDLSGTELRLSPKNTGAALDVNAAVDAAYAYGRSGTETENDRAQLMLRTQPYTIAVLPYLDLDTEYILDILTAYAQDSGSTLTQTSYGLEGDRPPLEADKFKATNPTQTLVITLGTPGIGFDAEDVYNKVLDAYSLHRFHVTIENVQSVTDPDPIDLEAIYAEYYIAPKDASVDLQTFKSIPGSYGYEFDMVKAQDLIDQAEFGDVIRIPMTYIEPEILDENMFFSDELGSVRVSYSSSKDRNTNLQLACDAINGTVLNPGESFSFNDTVGQRTSGKGYKSALENLSDDEDNEILGGGVGQVASALYHCVLVSDLEVTYRVNQEFIPEYIEAGLDVAVDWRSPDFQFTNTSGFPIRIEASTSNGSVSIQILGTDQRQYYVEVKTSTTDTEEPDTRYEDFEYDNEEGYEDGDVIQEGITGYTVKTYKYKYDKATGELLSKDFVSTSQYDAVDEIIARVEEEPTEPETEPETEPPTRPTWPSRPTEPPTVPTEPETQPTVPPTTAPTVPPETAPKIETEPTNPAADPVTETEPQQADVDTPRDET